MSNQKSDILARITAHGKRPPIEVHSEAWGLTLYLKPLSPAVRAGINKASGGDETQAACRMIMELAHDAEGNRIFDDSVTTLEALMKGADWNEIASIVNAMAPADSVAAAKNG